MLHDLFDKSIQIYRLKNVGSTNRKSFQSTATVEAALQNKVAEMTPNLGIHTSRNWVLYCDLSENILPGDQVRFNGKKYYVDEVTPRDYGINQHLEVLLKEANE